MATTTNYGWETPDDTDLVKDGALAMRTTANAIDSTLGTAFNNKLHAGLVLLKTQTIGSAVSSVTVTNAFNTNYDNYKIIISGGTSSTNSYLTLTIGNASAAYYGSRFASDYAAATTANANVNNQAGFLYAGFASSSGHSLNLDILQPFVTKPTQVMGNYSITTALSGVFYTGILSNSNSYTDFTVTMSGGGNVTGGTIAVYGYAKD